MDECRRRLADKDLPNTATNVPNLLHQYTRARAELNKVLELTNKSRVAHGVDGTFAEFLLNHQSNIFATDGVTILADEEIEDAEIVEDDA
jgi:heptaprenylglyceryl phosphate synthase